MARHRNHAAENISIRACDDSGKIFLFNTNEKETFIGAAGIGFPVVGCDNAFLDKLNTMLSAQFPAGTVVQFVQFSSADVDDIIDTYVVGKLNGNSLLRQLCENHADLYRNSKDQALVRASGVLANQKRLFFGIKIPVSGVDFDEQEWKDALTIIETAFDGLTSAQVRVQRIDQMQYRQFVAAMHNPWARESESVQQFDESTSLDEQILPVGTSLDYHYSKSRNIISFNEGEYFARILSVNFLPERAMPWVMNDVVGDWSGLNNQITDPYYLSVVLIYPDQQQAKASLLVRSGQINNQASPAIEKRIPEVGVRKKRIDVLVNETKGNSTIVDLTWTMVVYSREERRLERLTNSLVSYYSTLGRGEKKFDIRVDSRILRVLFEQAIPLNASAKGLNKSFRQKTVGVRHAVALLPLYGDMIGGRSPKGSLYVTRRGQPAILDFFESDTNYNGLVFAESGSGKSMQVQGLILDHLAAGGVCWAIDDGRSMEKMCRVIGGQFITFTPNSDVCLNPFTTIEPGRLEEELDLLKTMFTKMAAPNDGLNDKEMPVLERAIIQSYENHGQSASVKTVAEFLLQQPTEEARKLGEQLYPFASGQFSRWFDGDANINFNSNFVLLEMGELKQLPHLRDVVSLQLFAVITRGMRKVRRNVRKLLVIEEAKQWLYDQIMSKGIEDAFARARKDDGAAIAVTQSLLDIALSPSGQSILQNSSWMMILKQQAAAINSAIEKGFLELDPYATKMLESVHTVPNEYAEFMFKRNGHFGIYRSVFSRFQQVMLSTRGEERAAILEAIDQGVPALDAINEFLRREQDQQAARNDIAYQIRA